MPAILYDLVVLAGLLYLATLGSTVGTYVAVLAALELFVSLTLAVLLHEPIAAFLIPLIDDNLGFMLPEWLPLHAWILFFVFATLLWGTAFVLWTYVHPRLIPAASVDMARLDQVGGAVVGWFGGMLLIGAAMVNLSMLPIGLLQFPSRHMMFDVGSSALRAAGAFAGEQHEGRSMVLYGEPVSRESVGAAKLANEPWFDADANGQADESDPYCDSDGNGKFTKDLYYLDIDSDGRRRVGLLEKFTIGRWDLAVLVGGKDRPARTKIVAKPPPGASSTSSDETPPAPPKHRDQKQPPKEQTPAATVKPPPTSGTTSPPPVEPPPIDEF